MKRKRRRRRLPAENSEHQVHNEERSNDNKADEVDPRPTDAHRVVYLQCNDISNNPCLLLNQTNDLTCRT